jgi:hypothetical protein
VDIVDYFLFDAQEGYCDYFSSAMVVLSRAAGLPARLVVGYASGNFDSDLGVFEVIRADAHSWAEIYFPDIGWVEFEPTSSRSLIDRISEDAPESVPDKEFSFPHRGSFIWRKVGFGLLYSCAGLLLVLGFTVGFDFYTLYRKPAEKTAVIIYIRMISFSRWSKILFSPSLTPYEFADSYKNWFRDLWSHSRFTCLIETGEKSIDYLTQNCVLAIYGVNALDEGESKKMFAAWITLLPLLLASWIKSRFHKTHHGAVQETQTLSLI